MSKRIYFRKHSKVGLTLLEPECEADVNFIITYMNDPEVTQYLLRRTPLTAADEKDWLRKTNTSERDYVFGVTLTEDDTLIGMMGLHHVNHLQRTAITGAWIAEDGNRNKGLATIAKLLLLRFAFYDLGLEKVSSHVLTSNGRSRAYNEKCGYRVEGLLKADARVNGERVDAFTMAVFPETFAVAWEKFMT